MFLYRLFALQLLILWASRAAVAVSVRKYLPPVGALYFITDNSPNEVVALKVEDGLIRSSSFTSARGNGGIVGYNSSPFPTDSLQSSNAVLRLGKVRE
jgi:hypothetical protein